MGESMEINRLDDNDKEILLNLARQSIQRAVEHEPPVQLILSKYSKKLQENGASFVTLTKQSVLRGCIGTLYPYQPLVQDVCEHAIAAAISDYRFPPLNKHEIDEINIKISRLTVPLKIDYQHASELKDKIKPGEDGVIIEDGINRATFLPQVWEKLPNIEDFLSHLCQKMGARPEIWKTKHLQLSVYQVEEFHE